ncbi:MAG: translation initiation factor IF-2, partial [Nanoarchaeota archaeon]
VRKANVGTVTKSDVMEMKAHDDPIIFAFGVKVSPDIKKLAQDNNVALFDSNVIYKLIDEHNKWKQDATNRAHEATLRKVTRPGRIRVLPGYVFRQSKPAVFGVEVLKGIVRTGYRLHKKGKVVGEIKELQMEGNNVSEIKTGDKAAVSMEDVTIGKQVLEGDILDNFIVEHHKAELEKVKHKLTPEERELIAENQEK